MEPKRASESYTEQVQILTQANLNGFNRLFGGQLMEWIDIVAAVAARRHSEANVTTVLVETLEFKKAAYANDTILLTAKLVYVGRTSMEVCVKTYNEELNGEKTLINKAYIVLVALDDDEKPIEVPRLVIETDEEKREWEMAAERRSNRKKN